MIPVNPAPTRTPRIGLLKAVRRLLNFSDSASGATAPDINVIPVMSMANPMRILPISFFLCFLQIIIIITPISATIGEKEDGLSIFMKGLLLSTPTRLSIHAVSVVPISEPKQTPTVCSSDISPEFTKPTSITVIAEDDWMAMVTPMPRSIALILFEVIFWRAASSFPPVSFSRPVDITFIPYRKKASPPIMVNMLNIENSVSIFHTPFCLSLRHYYIPKRKGNQ
ncbi:MAG: hypothetical protein BWZ04_02517 [Firmicutes bacterium ADurb.BinA205]|nr:MAG: hypothetical protein BWZ04_02517 [Firmicutes bacterium ADurb.BinA205]